MIKIKIDQNDIRENISIRKLLKAQSGDLETIIEILSRYTFSEEGEKLTPEQARETVLDLTPNQLEKAMKAIYGAMADAAVPPASAASSN